MELQAIIGKRKGKIGDFNACFITSHLGLIGTIRSDNGYDTNANKVHDFRRQEVVKQGEGKNVYIHASNIKDPQGFYQYLSRYGFTLVDSILKLDMN